ncbi:GTP-binding protein [Rossellomorea aquimaris]|uniref:GTP-binding protein n=1 Tax=Rossellomorea aquimaris TaxID=189382 RepID=UPI001CD2A531|nr:GTP-binding protein [Rossellomorea aquimaris]MCA1056116.1 GTP-binding protein [Rossellomorea aquimaris]
MVEEKLLMEKSYYETFLIEQESTVHPIEILGEAFVEEQKNEPYDLTYIRYAQGEVYFHSKDYEAAIFKWESISDELGSWAKKNIADSYYALGMLSAAEDVYTAITTESTVLTMEISLQLFHLYIERDKLKSAYRIIEKALATDPDYPLVAQLAKSFYEEQQDWESAVGLAVKESIRTGERTWFQSLLEYADKGYTSTFTPNYFYDVLITIYESDREIFRNLIESLWQTYREVPSTHIDWVNTANTIFQYVEVEPGERWEAISSQFQQAYLHFLENGYLVKEIEGVMPVLLTNWLKISKQENPLLSASAVMAWNDAFSYSMEPMVVEEAENLLIQGEYPAFNMEETLILLTKIIDWSEKNGAPVSFKTTWIAEQLLDTSQQYLVVAGSESSGKSSFVQSVLGESVGEAEHSTVVYRYHHNQVEVTEIHDRGEGPVESIADFEALMERDAFVEYRLPSDFLQKNGQALIDVQADSRGLKDLASFYPAADGLLYVLNAESPFNAEDRKTLRALTEIGQPVNVHFLLNKMDKIAHAGHSEEIIDSVRSTAREWFPDAEVLPYSSLEAVHLQKRDVEALIKDYYTLHSGELKYERRMKLFYLVRKTLKDLFSKRKNQELGLKDAIEKNKDILVRLNGFHTYLEDMQADKTKGIKDSFRKQKEEMRKEISKKIPEILKGCGELITEDSDFRQIHNELNEAMNDRIQTYVNEDLMPRYMDSLESWLQSSRQELEDGQDYLHEMSTTFNQLFGQDKVVLQCDFQVIDDWRRDVSRMGTRAQVDKENILLKFKPGQFLLKSAGKLFGNIPQNKNLLYTQYKRYVENEDYSETAQSIMNKFFVPFDLFEKSLDQDVQSFFAEPFRQLHLTIADTEREVATDEESLRKMKENPERYFDPIRLFEVKLLQDEYRMKAGKASTRPSY